jgi:hypothetical protein
VVAEVVPIAPGIGSETGISAQYSGAQSSVVIGPQISSVQRMRVSYLQLDWDGSQEGTVQVYFGNDAFVRGTSKTLFDGGGHPTANSRGGFVASKADGWIGAVHEELRITSSGISPLSVTVWYSIMGA